MPRTMLGTGTTQRELLQAIALEALTKGHTVPMGGHGTAAYHRQLKNNANVANLSNPYTKNRYIVCGDTKMGDAHVCSGG